MAESERGKRFEIRVTEIDDPLPDATFGSIGRYVEVARADGLREPFVPQPLVLGFDDEATDHVDRRTLTIFEVDPEGRTFTPLESSRVNLKKREVSAWIDHAGTYGVIGLHKHPAVLETLGLFDRFSSQLAEESELGEHGFQDRICGLILCADPSKFGDAPLGPGDVCKRCLGLDLTYDRLPDKYLWERRPPIRELRPWDDGPEFVPVGPPPLLGWGDNAAGDLGDGTDTPRDTPVWIPGFVPKKIDGGSQWTIALGTDGSVWTWGFNATGQLGDGTMGFGRKSPAQVQGLPNIVDIAAGVQHAVAVDSLGYVWRWGLRDWRAPIYDTSPHPIPGLDDIVAVAAGYDFSLALRRDHITGATRVLAWGDNSSGKLGDGSQTYRSTPVQVSGLTAVRAIAAGPQSSFAIKSNGAVVAWGSGTSGTLGDGGRVDRFTPVAVPGLANVEQVAAGFHGIARTTAGEVWAWGPGSSGEMGNGTGTGNPAPAKVPGLSHVTAIAAGEAHCVAMESTGSVYAWGAGLAGQIGDGMRADQWNPVPVALPAIPAPAPSPVEVGAGERSSFAILG
ncbi:MAG TPA: hypothetical protein VH247_10305 [Thermoleophilaceae bacterium]|jgi:alpha-tubulin suppressor-like RCC1 family protein|nr:hypothetical protein [Thermoleophilaceae bacterium]